MLVFRAAICVLSWPTLLVALLWTLRHARREVPRREVLLYAALLTLSLALRITFKTDGLGHWKFDQWGAFIGLTADGLYHHGVAPTAFFRGLLTVLPPSPGVFVWSALLFGSLVPLLVSATARNLGVNRTGSFASGLLLALHPLFVRYSGVMNRNMMMVFLLTTTLWSLARFLRTRRLVSALTAVAASLLLVNTRLEAFFWVGLASLLPLFLLPRFRPGWIVSLVLALTAGATFVGNLTDASGYSDWDAQLTGALGSLGGVFDPEVQLWLSPDWTPWLVPLLAVLGLLTVVARPRALRIYLLFAILAASAALSNAGLAMPGARYQTPALLFVALAAGAGVSAIVAAARRLPHPAAPGLALAALAATLGLSTLHPWQHVIPSRTIDAEWVWLRSNLEELPESSVLTFVSFNFDSPQLEVGLNKNLLRWLGYFYPERSLYVRSCNPLEDQCLPANVCGLPRPSYYLHRGCCSLDPASMGDTARAEAVARISAACETMLVATGDRPLSETWLPGRAYDLDRYTAPLVRAGLYACPPK